MNTIKFAPYNDFTTEQHDLTTAKIKDSYYQPLNLNIFVTKICPCHCDFCFNSYDCFTEAIAEPGDRDYENSIVKSIEYFRDLGIEVEFTLTGGEPTALSYRFVHVLKILNRLKVKQRTISTTGLNLFEKVFNRSLLQHLVENGFTHNISISRMSHVEEIHNSIMKGRTITNEQLKQIAFFSEINGLELRVSSNLIKGAIEDLDSILSSVDEFYKLGIKTVLIREIQYYKNYLKLDETISKIKNDSKFKYLKTLKGDFYDVDIYIYESKYNKYIVKCYNQKENEMNKNIIGSVSLIDGVLYKGFKDEQIKNWNRKGYQI